MRLSELEQCFSEDAELHQQLLRFVQYQSLTLSQLAACNRLHGVEERLSRWLLMVQDRVDDSYLRLTHEFLAQMIGARRSTVTLVAGTLQRLGLIEYTRGEVTILDRPRLEEVACECYAVTQKLFQSLSK